MVRCRTVMTRIACLLRRYCLRLCGFGRIAEEGEREITRDSAQLPLHQIEKLVQTLAQNCRYVDRSEDAAQAIELFGSGIAVAQRVTRLDFAEQVAGLAYAMMQRTRKGLVEQQETGHARRGRAGRVQAPIGVVPGRRTQHCVPLADIDRRADVGEAR